MTVSTNRPRIGIIGTGAIGGFYGVMLARAGFDVHFLLRSEFRAVADDGLHIDSAVHGQLHLNPVQAYVSAEDMPPCDWLLVGTKTTANADLAPLIARAAAPGAKVLLLQNGLEVEEALRPLLPDSLHLLGGLCFICVHRRGPGVVVHQALGAVNIGYHSGPLHNDESARQALVEEGAALFHQAGIESHAMANLQQARWQKLVWNVPYNGLSVLLRASTTPLMGDAKMTEKMPDYWPSMYHDFVHQRPLELDAVYARPLAAAREAGCEFAPCTRPWVSSTRAMPEATDQPDSRVPHCPARC